MDPAAARFPAHPSRHSLTHSRRGTSTHSQCSIIAALQARTDLSLYLNEIEERGFAIVPDLLLPEEVDQLLAQLSQAFTQRTRAGARHLMGHPSVRALASDPRFLGSAREVLGEAAVPFRATLFDKSPDSNWLVVWHQDTALPLREKREVPGWGPWSVKAGVAYAHAPDRALAQVLALRVHLDDSRADNGPLRVLPRSHCKGVLSDASIEQLASTIEPVTCLVQRGGVLMMRPLIVHASSKATTAAPRRVLHIEYSASSTLDSGLDLAVA